MPADDDHSFEATCLPLLPDCYAFAMSLTRAPHDADDLVQDAFLKAYRGFHTFTPGTNAKAWLFTILRRRHIDRYRRGRRRPIPLPEDELTEMAGTTAVEGRTGAVDDPEASDLPITAAALGAAIESIPHPFRTPVSLRDVHGLSYREIGEILGVPSGTVMSRLHRGREYLRKRLVSPGDPPPPSDDK